MNSEVNMGVLFEPSIIGGMEVGNRFVRSATWEGMAEEDGTCPRRLIELVGRVAQGGVGLIIASHAYVRRDGQAGPGQVGVYQDALIEGLGKMAGAARDHGSRIVLQLAHAGQYADTGRTGHPGLTPSRIRAVSKEPSREMEAGDIQEIVDAFGEAASRAKKSGFDGVQIHAAHGYLLSEFLSPFYNRRKDGYGGSVKNRARLLLEVVARIRAAVGETFPILLKMNCQDFMEGGLALSDSLETGLMLQEKGIAAIEISGGTPRSGRRGAVRMRINSEEKEAYFRQEAKAFKERLRIPIILVGGIRTVQLAERLVTEGYADYISMSRPLIREPDLIKRWETGDGKKAACISCNRCFKPAGTGEGIYCVVERKENEKRESQAKR
jgi:2,4-dienoyl-CoA reductase-like NADH-dependent reductase (Old Yellow Enzyme family)